MKKALIIAAIILGAGIVIFIGALATVGFDVKKLGTVKFETNTYTAEGSFDRIFVEENTADIFFRKSEDGTCRVVCCEPESGAHTVEVKDGTLSIVSQKKNWKRFMDLSFEKEQITVYLPESAYGTLTVDTKTGNTEVPEWLRFDRIEITSSTGDVVCRSSVTDSVAVHVSTGDITLDGVSAASIECSMSTGHIRMQSVACTGDVTAKVTTGRMELNGLTCRDFRSEGSTGDVRLLNVVASGTLAIERSTGDVSFQDSDAAEIRIVTSTGDVKGTLRSAKIFTVKTSTGDVNVPSSASGGKCEIKTSTGDVKIGIASGK